VPLIELPAALDGHPHEVHFIEDDPQRANRPLQDGGKRHVETDAARPEVPSGGPGLSTPLVRQVDIRPSREEVFQIPGALAVAAQDEFAGHGCRTSKILV
jgi:hypothetical protein